MDCAFAVHRELGPGFREEIYQWAFCLELEISRNHLRVREADRLSLQNLAHSRSESGDLVLQELLIVEVKAVPELLEVHERQLWSYLKTMKLRAGLLTNFNTLLLKHRLCRGCGGADSTGRHSLEYRLMGRLRRWLLQQEVRRTGRTHSQKTKQKSVPVLLTSCYSSLPPLNSFGVAI